MPRNLRRSGALQGHQMPTGEPNSAKNHEHGAMFHAEHVVRISCAAFEIVKEISMLPSVKLYDCIQRNNAQLK